MSGWQAFWQLDVGKTTVWCFQLNIYKLRMGGNSSVSENNGNKEYCWHRLINCFPIKKKYKTSQTVS